MSERPSQDRPLPADSPQETADAAAALLADEGPAALAAAAIAGLRDGTELARDHLLRALPRVPGADGMLPHLDAALRAETEPGRRNAARSLAARMAAAGAPGADRAIAHLRGLATADADADVRVLAATALGESRNVAAVDAVASALDDPEPNVAAAAAEALGLLGSARALPALTRAASTGESWVRLAAVFALGAIGDPRGLEALSVAARDPALAGVAADAMAAIGDPEAFPALRTISALGGAAAESARDAGATIVARTGAAPPDWLRAAFARQTEHLRERLVDGCDEDAARLLGIAGTREAAAALLEALERPELRPAAGAGLEALPDDVAAAALLDEVPRAEPDARIALLGALPRLMRSDHLARLMPLLAEEAAVRAAAVDAICRGPAEAVRPLLLAALEDPERRAGAAYCLGRLEDPPCDRLAELLQDEDGGVRVAAAEALGRCRGNRMAAAIGARLDREPDRRARQALLRALGAAGGDDVVPPLRAALADDDPAERFAAAVALGETGAPTALEPLLAALDDPAEEVQVAALRALGSLGEAGAAEALVAHLDVADRDVRRTAAAALQRLAPAAALRRLRTAVLDPDWEIRLAAVRTLRRMAEGIDEDSLRRIRDEDPDPLVRSEATRALDARGAGAAAGGDA